MFYELTKQNLFAEPEAATEGERGQEDYERELS